MRFLLVVLAIAPVLSLEKCPTICYFDPVTQKVWTRIYYCNSLTDNGLDLPVSSLQSLANNATQILITKPDGTNVVSTPFAYPLQRLRQGQTISYPLDGTQADAENIAQTWNGPQSDLDALTQTCQYPGSIVNRFYHACNNWNGLHLFPSDTNASEGALCGWTFSGASRPVEVYIDTGNGAQPDWTCADTIYVPISLSSSGDVQCMSLDGKNCLWTSNDTGCLRTLSITNRSLLFPLVCGAMHLKIYGETGYEDATGAPNPTHWCYRGRAYFFGSDAASVTPAPQCEDQRSSPILAVVVFFLIFIAVNNVIWCCCYAQRKKSHMQVTPIEGQVVHTSLPPVPINMVNVGGGGAEKMYTSGTYVDTTGAAPPPAYSSDQPGLYPTVHPTSSTSTTSFISREY